MESLIQLQVPLGEVVENTPRIGADVALKAPEEEAVDDLLINPNLNHDPLREAEDEDIHRLRRNLVLISRWANVPEARDANTITPRTEKGLTVPRIVGHLVVTKEVVYPAVHLEESSPNVFYLKRVIVSLVQHASFLTPLARQHLAHLKREVRAIEQLTALHLRLFARGGPKP